MITVDCLPWHLGPCICVGHHLSLPQWLQRPFVLQWVSCTIVCCGFLGTCCMAFPGNLLTCEALLKRLQTLSAKLIFFYLVYFQARVLLLSEVFAIGCRAVRHFMAILQWAWEERSVILPSSSPTCCCASSTSSVRWSSILLVHGMNSFDVHTTLSSIWTVV